ncbi:hypothetical protein [Marinicellulosiphila megalodicopiae]|uniref:hypothetical protein n=1 Tax=Marinicellulosiphila megalodicopiae TaxID=2724896 RepID=UPI003BAE6503
MNNELADVAVERSQLKQTTIELLAKADGSPIAILNKIDPIAYIISADIYNQMLSELDEYGLSLIAENRKKNASKIHAIQAEDL